MATNARSRARACPAPSADRTRPRLRLAAFVLAVLTAIAVRGGADAGDPALAKFLLDAGRKSIEKKQYDDALTKLEKAAAEDPTLLEARYWIAVAQDRKGDQATAIEAFRAFRDACASSSAQAPLDKELGRLVKTAEARLAILAAAEGELQKLDQAFAAKALAFAKANFLRDPTVAGNALRAVLAVTPDDEEAKRLLEKLGGTPVAGPETKTDAGPYKDVKKWEDFLAGKFLKDSAMVYGEELLTIDDKDGHFYWPRKPYDSTKSYVFELEFRLMTAHTKEWALGLGFAHDPTLGWFTAHVGQNEVVIWEAAEAGKKDVGQSLIEPIETGAWHRLALVVSGQRAELFLDDKKRVSQEIKSRRDLGGNIGMFHQDNRCEIRRWRFGVRE